MTEKQRKLKEQFDTRRNSTGGNSTGTTSTSKPASTVSVGSSNNKRKQLEESFQQRRNRTTVIGGKKEEDEKVLAFFRDAKNYLNEMSNASSRASWGSTMNASNKANHQTVSANWKERANWVRSYLRENKDAISQDQYLDFVKQLNSFDSALKQISRDRSNAEDFFSQWKSEKEYSDWKNGQIEYNKLKTFDIQAGEREIGDLEKILNEYKALSRTMIDDRMQARLDYITENYGDEKGIKALISEKTSYLNQAKRMQEGVRLGSVGDKSSKFYDPEYDYWAKTRGKLPTQEDLVAYDSMMDQSKWYTDADGKLYDAFGTEIDPYKKDSKGNILHPSQGSVDSSDKLGIFLSASGEAVQESAGTYLSTGGTWETILAEGSQRHWDRLEENEINTYYYYLNKEGSKAAEKYLDSIQESLNRRAGTEMFKPIEDKTALELLFKVAVGLDQFNSGLQGLRNAFTGNDEYIPVTATQFAGSMVQEDLGDVGPKLPDWLGGGTVAQAAGDFISTGANMLPSILTSTVVGALNPTAGAALGTGLLSASAGGNAYTEMVNFGYDANQSRTYAAMVGASEAVLQSLLGGVSKLGGGAIGKGVTKVLGKADNVLAKLAIQFGNSNLGKVIINAVEEGSEEYLQSILEPWFRNMVFGEENEIDLLSEEALYSALLGALTGGVFEGSGVALDKANTNAMLRDTGKAIIGADGGVDALKALAMDVSGAKFSKQANKVSSEPAAGEGITGKVAAAIKNSSNQKKVGKLYQAVEAEVTSQNQADIAKALNEKGFSESSAKNIAEAVVTKMNGTELNKFQKAVLESVKDNKMVDETVNQIINDPESGVSKRTGNLDTYSMGVMLGKGIAPEATREAQKTTLKVSEDGKTTVDGKEIKVEFADNGLLATEDGTVTVSDVAYSTATEAYVVETIATLGLKADEANSLLRSANVNGMNDLQAQAFATGLKSAYNMGRVGNLAELNKNYFTSKLTAQQREQAYAAGLRERNAEVAYKQAAIDEAQKAAEEILAAKTEPIDKNGSVIFENGVTKKDLSTKQKAAYLVARKVSSTMGNDIHLYSGKVEYGYYDIETGDVWLNINSSASGKDLTLFTLSHEMTHHAKQWRPEEFTAFADTLLQAYGEKGKSVEQMIKKQISKAKSHGITLTREGAYEEVISDAAQRMLVDSNALEKLGLMEESHPGTIEKIKAFLKQFLEKIRELFKNVEPNTDEAIYLAEMEESVKALLYEKFENLMVSTAKTYSTIKAAYGKDVKAVPNYEIITDGAVTIEGDGKKYSIKSMKHDIAEGKMFEDLKAVCGWTEAETAALKDQLEQIVAYMTPFRDIVDMNETSSRDDRRFSPYKPNSDPLYTISMDFSTLCSKRLLTQYVIENLQLRENRPMSAEEQIAIRDMLIEYRQQEKALQVACAMCYVEAARLKSPKQMNRWMSDPSSFMRDYFADHNPEFAQKIKDAQEDFKESRGYDRKAPKKDMKQKDITELNKIRPNLRKNYTPSAEEQAIIDRAVSLPNSVYLTAGNLADLSESDPIIYKAYTSFVRTATRSKGLEEDIAYYYGDSTRDNGNGIIVSDSFIESVNRENGMRFSSWSDWRIEHLLDYITAVIDNSVRGAAMHGYTKFPDEVRVLGKTGMMFNMSGVAGTQTGLTEDGSLSFSETESINFAEAKALREEFPETAGLQCIGVGDEHIRQLLRSDIIDYVIPYHTSGLNAVLRRMVNIHGWKDYTGTQHATPDKSISKEKVKDPENWHKEPVFSEFFVGYDTGMTGIEAMKKSAENYKQMCRDRGLTPKFAQFLDEDGYWKLLIDRKMVNNKTGKLIRQKPVKPVFDTETIKGIVDKYVDNYDGGLQSKALNHVVENWDSLPARIKDLKKAKKSKTKKALDTLANETVAAQPGKKFSLPETSPNVSEQHGRADAVKNSLPTTEDTSTRTLLANAFESVAQDEKEREKLAEYKANISIVNAKEQRLREINAKLFQSKTPLAKGERIKLQDEAVKLRNQITIYDAQLLRLEASKPLQNVLNREKAKVRKQMKEQAKKDIQAAKLEEQQRFNNRVANHEKVEMRKKIRKTIRDLDKILNHGNKKQNVKDDMKGLVSSAIQSAEVLFTENYSNEDIIQNGFGVQLSAEEQKHFGEAQNILQQIFNLGTGYEAMAEREKLKNKLSYRMAQLRDAFFRERNRLNETRVSEVLGNLADAYSSLETSEYLYIKYAYHESVHEYLKYLQNEVGGTTVHNMSMSQLENLHKAYTMVLETVRNANNMFNENLKEGLDQLANAIMREVRMAGGEHGDWTKIGIKRNKFSWNNLKPIYAAERVGSETFSRVVSGLFDGQYKWATNMEKARAFQKETSKKYGVNNWDMEQAFKFTSSNELDFTLNLEQILALYAYSKREAAHDHITNGGIVFGKNTEVIENKHGIKVHKLKRSATTYSISDTLLGEIISKLDDNQKKYVDEMQKYLSETMGGLGNEVSMRLYGVKLFGEENYFPLRSAGQYMEKARDADLQKQQGHTSLVNSGFTHAVKPHAKNPIVLDGFMDVWAGHVNEMSMYNGMVLPMEDFRKVYNYHTPFGDGSTSVNGVIENAYGAEATSYFDQLYQELNSGAVSDPRETDMLKWVGKFKKAAVMMSASVVMQQPSAIGRAFALIDPKYFVGQRISESDSKKQWDEVKKYAPVAIIKEMGGFDTHTGAGAKDFLLAKEYSKDEIAKALKDKDYLKEKANVIMGYLPSKADEITWVAIWQAVKREVRASNPNLHGEEFLKKAGSRFSEVIEKTQVYDSVLAKSANMRAKTGLMTMATSFMAEPTTTINMIENAFHSKKNVGRVLASVLTSIILNNFLASWIYAMRDDDEDETFLEKYAEAFTSGMVDDLNPITYYPFLKDVWSIFQGYDVERSDMSIISDVSDALKKALQLIGKDTSNMDEDELAEYHKTVWSAILSLVDGAFSALGVPFKNARREVESWFNTSHTLKNGLSYNRTSLLNTITESSIDALPVASYMWKTEKSDMLYDSILSGNTAYVDRLRSEYDDEKQINNAIRKGLRENDSRIYEAALAQINGHPEERVKLQKQVIADGFKQDDVVAATNTIINKLSPSSDTSDPKKKGLYTSDDFTLFVAGGKANLANEAKKDIIATHQLNGKTAEEAEQSFRSSAKTDLKQMLIDGKITVAAAEHGLKTYCGMDAGEAKTKVNEWNYFKSTGVDYSDKREQFLAGEMSASDLVKALVSVEGKTEEEAAKTVVSYTRDAYEDGIFDRSNAADVMVTYGGLTDEEAEAKLRYIDVKQQFPDTFVDDAWVDEYYAEVETSGIPMEVFVDYRNQVKGITGKDKKEGRMAVINSMPISNAQKDALYYAEGWAASKLHQAPWR